MHEEYYARICFFVRETITLVVKYGFIGAVYGFAVLLELEKKLILSKRSIFVLNINKTQHGMGVKRHKSHEISILSLRYAPRCYAELLFFSVFCYAITQYRRMAFPIRAIFG